MLVKCVHCGEKIDRDLAFKVRVGKVNKYYCTEMEYKTEVGKKEVKDNVYILIDNIFGYKITHTSLYKEISEISTIHTFSKINEYLIDRQKDLSSIMSRDFSSEYGKIRYFSAILKNSLTDYIVKKEEIKKEIIVDIAKDNYTIRKRRKTLLDFEEEVGE